MKLTSLIITPEHSWESPGANNPLKAVIKLASEKSTVECVLSDETMRKMLDLCATEIARNAEARVAEFVQAVTAIEGAKDQVLLGEDSK